MRSRLLIIFFLNFGFQIGGAIAQGCGSISYNSDNGLPASNYFDLFQDSKGYLWVGSYGSGVSFFDGKKWENWNQANKIGSNAVGDIFEDKEGAIWLCHFEHGVTRIKDGNAQFFNFDLEKDTCPVGQLYLDPEEKNVIMLVGNSGHIHEYDFSKRTFVDKGMNIIPDEIFRHYDFASFPYFNGDNNRQLKITAWNSGEKKRAFYYVNHGQLQQVPTPPSRLEGTSGPRYHLQANGMAFVYDKNNSFAVVKDGKEFSLPTPTIQQYPPGNKQPPLKFTSMWLDENSHSFFVLYFIDERSFAKRYVLADYDAVTLRLRQTLVFANQFLTKRESRPIIKDAAGTIWLCTSGNVMRLFPDQFFLPFSTPGMPAQAWGVAQSGSGHIWFSSYGDGLAAFDGLNFLPPPQGLKFLTNCNDGSLTDAAGNIYFNAASGPTGGILKFDGKNSWEFLAGTPNLQGFILNRDKKGQIMWGTSEHGLWVLPKNRSGHDASDWEKIDKSKGLELLNVLTCLEDKYERYWMGRLSQGIAMYDAKIGKVINWTRADNPKNFGSMSMAEDPRGNLWFGTDRGLCFFENKKEIEAGFDLSKHLQRIGITETDSSTVMSMVTYDAHKLIFGNAKGVFVLDLDAFYNSPRHVLIRSFTLKNGYQAGSVGQNAFFVARDSTLWLTAANGAARFDPRMFVRDTVPPVLFLDSLRTGSGIFRDLKKTIRMNSGELSVQFFFHASTNPLLFDNTHFEFRLTGDTTWKKVIQGQESMTFTNLNSGKYTFEVRAVKEGIISKTASVHFEIPKVWWQNPAFWLFLIGILSSIGGYLYRQLRKIKDQEITIQKNETDMEKLGKEKTQLQVAAIVNQLNPHFINNTLNWLQIRVDEDEEAVNVVGKLSQNISMVFKNSRQKKPYHALREELRLTENYLFIQKCRFRDRLQYEMPEFEPNSTAPDVNVPMMMIQIHTENAVEHGIRNKKDGAGMVRISVREDQDFIVLNILDNGVGRKAAAKIGSKGTQNGTLMLKELERIYNSQNNLHIEQRYEDDIFTLPDGTPCGTRVTVRIPKVYNFEI